ncbi:hypothetical protein P4O66_001186 [Electrophorus voltai]|uniref:Uncharacterized protein n=1 Tax=Electrophorus voltai TaxID=2609070 RepID=A0AAD8ZB19_9TELE|nr:hypothetical protein P4O66_001186 [Electrophorus voltai]
MTVENICMVALQLASVGGFEERLVALEEAYTKSQRQAEVALAASEQIKYRDIQSKLQGQKLEINVIKESFFYNQEAMDETAQELINVKEFLESEQVKRSKVVDEQIKSLQKSLEDHQTSTRRFHSQLTTQLEAVQTQELSKVEKEVQFDNQADTADDKEQATEEGSEHPKQKFADELEGREEVEITNDFSTRKEKDVTEDFSTREKKEVTENFSIKGDVISEEFNKRQMKKVIEEQEKSEGEIVEEWEMERQIAEDFSTREEKEVTEDFSTKDNEITEDFHTRELTEVTEEQEKNEVVEEQEMERQIAEDFSIIEEKEVTEQQEKSEEEIAVEQKMKRQTTREQEVREGEITEEQEQKDEEEFAEEQGVTGQEATTVTEEVEESEQCLEETETIQIASDDIGNRIDNKEEDALEEEKKVDVAEVVQHPPKKIDMITIETEEQIDEIDAKEIQTPLEDSGLAATETEKTVVEDQMEVKVTKEIQSLSEVKDNVRNKNHESFAQKQVEENVEEEIQTSSKERHMGVIEMKENDTENHKSEAAGKGLHTLSDEIDIGANETSEEQLVGIVQAENEHEPERELPESGKD